MTVAEQGPPQDRMHDVWERVESRRSELDMPMSHLAQRAGTDRSNLYRWRRHLIAGRDIGADALDALNGALELPHGELRRIAGKPAPALPGTPSPFSVTVLNDPELESYEKEALLQQYESYRRGHRERGPK